MTVDALIFAGGTGTRMTGSDRPKQFLEVGGRPILVHTIERFAGHPQVDGITVVCLADWIERLERCMAGMPYVSKVSVVPGGDTGQESIYRGVRHIREMRGDVRDDVVLVHDGVRPIIDAATISACIQTVREHGGAVTVSPAIETIVSLGDDGRVASISDRSTCALARAPQGFWLHELASAHERARAEDLEFIDSLSLMAHYGRDAWAVEGQPQNIKVTTPTDYFACKAYMDMNDYGGLWGGV